MTKMKIDGVKRILSITGPLAGFLCKRYGCRLVTILGGFLSAVGIFAGSQAQNILHLCISVGGITGKFYNEPQIKDSYKLCKHYVTLLK